MRPKFEVGEVVLLRSKSRPHLNGDDYKVHAILAPNQGHISRLVKNTVIICDGDGWGYILDDSSGPVIDDTDGDEMCWSESVLRKKHQPGEMSFDSLMASLSSPKLLTHQPEGVAPL